MRGRGAPAGGVGPLALLGQPPVRHLQQPDQLRQLLLQRRPVGLGVGRRAARPRGPPALPRRLRLLLRLLRLLLRLRLRWRRRLRGSGHELEQSVPLGVGGCPRRAAPRAPQPERVRAKLPGQRGSKEQRS